MARGLLALNAATNMYEGVTDDGTRHVAVPRAAVEQVNATRPATQRQMGAIYGALAVLKVSHWLTHPAAQVTLVVSPGTGQEEQ